MHTHTHTHTHTRKRTLKLTQPHSTYNVLYMFKTKLFNKKFCNRLACFKLLYVFLFIALHDLDGHFLEVGICGKPVWCRDLLKWEGVPTIAIHILEVDA